MANQPSAQNFQNHAKYVPLFHFVAVPILITNFIWSAYRAAMAPSWPTVLAALVAAAMVITIFLARVFALKVQDRVIRLEMRLRLRDVLSTELRGRIPELTRPQLVALRFASDAELPELVRDVLVGGLSTKKATKERVKKLRQAIVPALIPGDLSPAETARRWRHLADCYFAQQLACYPIDYLAEKATVERILETVERYEEVYESVTDSAGA